MNETMAYLLKVLERLANTPSPSGFCKKIMEIVEEEVAGMGYALERTRKGNGLIALPWSGAGERETLLLSAHLDTLGAMVRSIKSDGMLRFTCVGGFSMHSVEGEYCTVHTREMGDITGTILSTMPSVHVYAEARTQERKEEVMEVRLDREVRSKEDVLELGIRVGDYISFDPRFCLTGSGFVKSRHLDDKAGIAILLGLLYDLEKTGTLLDRPVKIMFSTYEEVGHGSSHIPDDIDEILAIDMGAMGDDLSCSEKDVSICVKDSSGPYDYEMVGILTGLAKELSLDYALDVYPSYASDASAALHGGANIRAALIGPGVHASHSMERTHVAGLENTLALLRAYVTRPV